MWLVACAELADLAVVRDDDPALWRDVRRFNAPVQLAVAAAHAVLARAVAPREAALISLAPCHAGSPELHRWVREIEAGDGVKMNPTHTLHALDNLALSVLSIRLANHAWAMSLGGAAGMAWSALEMALERAELGDHEVVVVGGDQLSGSEPSPVSAFALLLARERTPFEASGRAVRLVGVERRRKRAAAVPHAAAGAIAMLAALRAAPQGPLTYEVPAADGDGIDDIAVRWEVA